MQVHEQGRYIGLMAMVVVCVRRHGSKWSRIFCSDEGGCGRVRSMVAAMIAGLVQAL